MPTSAERMMRRPHRGPAEVPLGAPPNDVGGATRPAPTAEPRAPASAAVASRGLGSYDRLNAVDRQFLIYESAAVPMHIGGAGVLEAGALRRPDGALDIGRIRAFIESRLPRIPRYRQVVSFTPFGRHIWVDDPHFDVEYHVRHTSLPRPGGEAELKALCGRLFSQGLDRRKPLWEVWIVDGLEGDRLGFISKVHHAMVDGVRSIDLVEAILTPDPITEFEPAPPWKPRARPSAALLALDDLVGAARVGLDFGERLPQILREAIEPGSELRRAVRAAADLYLQTVWTPSAAPFNRPIGPHRRFDWIDTPLVDVAAVRRALGGSVNDVVLATMAGAVRRFLQHRRIEPDGLDFRVMVPVSIAGRTGRSDQLGNRLSAWMVPLPIGERDPRRQLEIVHQTTARFKEERNALGFLLWTQISGLAPAPLLWLGSELMWRSLPCNMVVTNVPGPERTLHLLGARMLSYRGTLPLTNYLGLATSLVSYQGTLQWGFTGDWDLVPDLDVFARCVGEAFAGLRAAVP